MQYFFAMTYIITIEWYGLNCNDEHLGNRRGGRSWNSFINLTSLFLVGLFGIGIIGCGAEIVNGFCT